MLVEHLIQLNTNTEQRHRAIMCGAAVFVYGDVYGYNRSDN